MSVAWRVVLLAPRVCRVAAPASCEFRAVLLPLAVVELVSRLMNLVRRFVCCRKNKIGEMKDALQSTKGG